MSKRGLVVLLLVAGIVGLFGVDPVFAYGEKVESSLWKIVDWLSTGLGLIAITFGIVWTGIRVSMGDENAFRNGLKIVVGGILIFGARYIADLVKEFF